MLEKQAISVVQPNKGSFISQIFVIPKRDEGYRPVVNLKALNKFIAEEHFKMEGFHMVKDLAEPKDWMAKIDLKDAYFLDQGQVNHKFLRFECQGHTYQFHCLPFGPPQSSSSLPEGDNNQADNLPGRHLGVVQEQGDLDRSAELDTGLIPVLGPYHQPQEVSVRTNLRHCVSRPANINA